MPKQKPKQQRFRTGRSKFFLVTGICLALWALSYMLPSLGYTIAKIYTDLNNNATFNMIALIVMSALCLLGFVVIAFLVYHVNPRPTRRSQR